jgi:DNA replication protein DnaC
LLLAGPPGTGKTATLAYLVAEFHRRGDLTGDRLAGYRWEAPSVRFAKVRDLYASVFDRRSGPLAAARSVDVLLLDDWGAAYEHDWPLAELDGLVDHRWDRQLATVVTTNLPATRQQSGHASFEATAERAYSRLCGAPGPGLVVMDRRDLRR